MLLLVISCLVMRRIVIHEKMVYGTDLIKGTKISMPKRYHATFSWWMMMEGLTWSKAGRWVITAKAFLQNWHCLSLKWQFQRNQRILISEEKIWMTKPALCSLGKITCSTKSTSHARIYYIPPHTWQLRVLKPKLTEIVTRVFDRSHTIFRYM